MLTSDPLFKFPLVHEVIVYGLFEIMLHGFWLKVLSETITDVNHNIFINRVLKIEAGYVGNYFMSKIGKP